GQKPLALYESGAILLYLAKKAGMLVPTDEARRWETIQWLFWQVGFVGPMFGQVGYYKKFEGKEMADKRPLQRYAGESRRLFDLLEARLEGRTWVMGNEYTVADISLLGMVRNFVTFYEAGDLVGFDSLKNVAAWLERGLARPAVQRGLNIPAKPQGES